MTTAATLATAYVHGPGKQIKVGPPPRPDVQPGQRIPLTMLTMLAAQGPFPAAVARLLVDVMSPARWEQWNQYNDHRAYPSPRAAYLVDVALAVGDRRLLVDAARRATVGAGVPRVEDTVRLDFILRRERLSAGYGEFGDALVDLEAGHLAGALVEHALRLGIRAAADGQGVTLWPGNPSGNPVAADPLPARSSGIGPRGLSADPRPLPHSAFRTLVDAIARPPAGSLTHRGLRHRLAVHNVTGVPDGWYTMDTVNPVEPVVAGSAMDAVQHAYGHPRSTAEVAGMNVALVTTADIPAAVTADGPDAYRDLLRAAGAGAQHACSAAARAGMFCRPVRSVDEGLLEAAVLAPLSHSLLYVLLAGRQRISCFPYDLTSLGTP